MKRILTILALLTLPAAASTLKVTVGSATRVTGSEVEGNYAAAHVFVDETAGDSVPFTFFFDPQTTGVQAVELFTNLNRRDRATVDANSDGIEDGIKPPPGSLVTAGSDAHYYKAYPLGLVNGGYLTTINATKTGAYRVNVRWRLNSDAGGVWRYYTSDPDATGTFGDLNFRAYSVIVSPKTSRSMSVYELNTLNIEAEGSTEALRSTFVDLWDGPGSTRTPRWNLDYVRGLGVNWLWFQPIHPIGVDGRHLSAADINTRAPGTGATTRFANGSDDVNYPYAFGSPYAVKNFFEIEPRMSKANTRPAAMAEFQGFVNAADNGGTDTVNVMLDAPFNHTSWDCELGAKGVTYFSSGASPTDEIRNREGRFFSRNGNYAMRAFSAASVAVAPDRGDFGKFLDTYDIYWGRYAALVATNPGNNGDYLNEGDWFDYSIGFEGSSGGANGHFDTIAQNVWRYFGDYCLHWLDQTGCTAGTSSADQVWKGIDGLRADFAQGMPPQGWEYVINKTRSRKWAFVFMAESLDGGAVTYRSSRHFDVLNENILFGMKGLSVGSNSMTSDFRNLFESRRSSYGQGLVLLNTTSHDEDNYSDPWEPLIRTAVCATIDGAPMIFAGQELGTSTTYGHDLYERNLGKFIPHFKTWNSMLPIWSDTNYGNDQIYPVYAGIGAARKASAALRSSNRYFIDRTSGAGTHQRIFSVVKYETANASPATSDVVFGFANLDRNAAQNGTFNVNITQNGSNLFGIKSARSYNVRNLAAYTALDSTRRDTLLWGAGRTGSDVLANGVFAGLNSVPATNGAWNSAPYEAQYLKLLDTTAPVATPAQPLGANIFAYSIGNSVTFSWPAVGADSEGVVPSYRVNVSINGAAATAFTTNIPNYTVTASEGQTVSITVQAVNPNDTRNAGPSSASSATIRLLNSNGDEDGDGQTNASEHAAGMNPNDNASVFKITNTARPSASTVTVTWASATGKSYEVWATNDLTSPFVKISGSSAIPSAGTSTDFTDTAASGPAKFYQVRTAP